MTQLVNALKRFYCRWWHTKHHSTLKMQRMKSLEGPGGPYYVIGYEVECNQCGYEHTIVDILS